jgi:hypothetical protein
MFRVNAFLLVALLGLARLSAQDAPPSPATLVWQDILTRYQSFDAISPVIVNSGQQSVFLSRIWPHGSAQLERLYESTGKWEAGEWSGGCGTVGNATIPIEIKPHTDRRVPVDWQLSTDDWDKPKHFVVGGSHAKRPIEGRYRFVLRYSLTPWTVIQHPGTIYEIVSPDFFLIQ